LIYIYYPLYITGGSPFSFNGRSIIEITSEGKDMKQFFISSKSKVKASQGKNKNSLNREESKVRFLDSDDSKRKDHKKKVNRSSRGAGERKNRATKKHHKSVFSRTQSLSRHQKKSLKTLELTKRRNQNGSSEENVQKPNLKNTSVVPSATEGDLISKMKKNTLFSNRSQDVTNRDFMCDVDNHEIKLNVNERQDNIHTEDDSEDANPFYHKEESIVDIEIAAHKLHFACWANLPVEHVVSILYKYPEVINNRSADSKGCLPLDILIERAKACSCGCCNYNRHRVIAALAKGEDYYRYGSNRDLNEDDDSSTKTIPDNERKQSVTYELQPSNNKYVATLSKAVLDQKDKTEKSLLSQREFQWIKHCSNFEKLINEVMELQQEKININSQIIEKNEKLKKLSSTLFKNEAEQKSGILILNGLKFMSKNNADNERNCHSYFDIGMNHLDTSKLESLLLHIDEQLEKSEKDLNSLNSVAFNYIDDQLEELVGKRSLRNCAVYNDLTLVTDGRLINQVENLRRRFI